MGFEPTVPLLGGTRDFQSRSFGQLGHLSAVSLTRNAVSYRPLANSQNFQSCRYLKALVPRILSAKASSRDLIVRFSSAVSHSPKAKFSSAEIPGGEGGIRTHVPRFWQGKSISSRPRYDHFGTSPFTPILCPSASGRSPAAACGIPPPELRGSPLSGGLI